MGVTGDTQTSAAGEETATVQVQYIYRLRYGTVLVADSLQKVLASIPTVLSTYMANTASIYWTTAVLVRNLKIGVFYGTGRRIPVQPHSYMR